MLDKYLSAAALTLFSCTAIAQEKPSETETETPVVDTTPLQNAADPSENQRAYAHTKLDEKINPLDIQSSKETLDLLAEFKCGASKNFNESARCF